MKDLKIQYWSQNRLQTKSYNTIMDFLDNDELPDDACNFRAIFFENKHNIKTCDEIQELKTHCKYIIS